MRLAYRDRFLKDMKALPYGSVRSELADNIDDLKEALNITELLAYHSVKKLDGYSNYYRLRIGNYRLGFRLENDGSLTLLRFLKRDEVYSKFP